MSVITDKVKINLKFGTFQLNLSQLFRAIHLKLQSNYFTRSGGGISPVMFLFTAITIVLVTLHTVE